MTKFKIYKLRFTAPLHLGDEKAIDFSNSLQTIHSDTMYAALTSVLAKIGKDIPVDGDLGFNISSLFPYYQDKMENKPVYFLPKLKSQSIPHNQNIAKLIKKIEWLDVDNFNKQINGKDIFGDDFNVDQITGKFLSGSKIEDFIEKEINPRVKVPRDFNDDAEPFYMERLFFKGNSGMYFLVHQINNKYDTIELALNILKDEGIGTDRTVGNGYFEWSSDEIKIDIPESNYVANLSMFIPENKEQLNEMLASDSIAYDFTKRGGWITDSGLNTFRKNSIYMFTEGGVFSTKKTKEVTITGKIVDLNPGLDYEHLKIKEHPIWRNGKAIFIPVKL